MIREIDVDVISEAVAELCIAANLKLPCSLRDRITESISEEESPLCREVLHDLTRNLDCAEKLNIPICQDTGMAVIFLEIGQDVRLFGGDLTDAVNRGVAKGYTNGKLRLSIVRDPLQRENTGDNTPAIIHTKIVPGCTVKIIAAPKGFGSENMSRIKMFNPTSTADEIITFVVDTVSAAGSNPCPPIVAGVGIGGDFEYAALLAKQAVCRDIAVRHPEPFYQEMENTMLTEINKLGVGAQGFGGRITALGVNIETFPTHIAGLPVAVNIGCHVTRHAEKIL